ncbi:MAG: cupin domain-containing protein [Acidobacteria bacterium]|nr:cupin domain-containing protein [Acidobacteriota bacterium]
MSSEHFTGTAWTHEIVANDPAYPLLSGSVHFEPSSRTDWHSHPGGQIIIVTEGEGYYQEAGRDRRIIRRGDVIKSLPGVRHWHGASRDRAITFVHVVPNAEDGYLIWYEAVTDEQYFKG